jgi:hypothetical protein
LRKVYRPGTEKEVWGIRTNEELRGLYETIHTLLDIKMRHLKWLGNVVGVDLTKAAKNIF